jgi:hypothetical protein
VVADACLVDAFRSGRRGSVGDWGEPSDEEEKSSGEGAFATRCCTLKCGLWDGEEGLREVSAALFIPARAGEVTF